MLKRNKTDKCTFIFCDILDTHLPRVRGEAPADPPLECPEGEDCVEGTTPDDSPAQTLKERREVFLGAHADFDIVPDQDGAFRVPCTERDMDDLDFEIFEGMYRETRRETHVFGCNEGSNPDDM